MEYDVAFGKDIPSLVESVCWFIEQGYFPWGGLSWNKQPPRLYQAVVRVSHDRVKNEVKHE